MPGQGPTPWAAPWGCHGPGGRGGDGAQVDGFLQDVQCLVGIVYDAFWTDLMEVNHAEWNHTESNSSIHIILVFSHWNEILWVNINAHSQRLVRPSPHQSGECCGSSWRWGSWEAGDWGFTLWKFHITIEFLTMLSMGKSEGNQQKLGDFTNDAGRNWTAGLGPLATTGQWGAMGDSRLHQLTTVVREVDWLCNHDVDHCYILSSAFHRFATKWRLHFFHIASSIFKYW